jgi:hypothetical protein
MFTGLSLIARSGATARSRPHLRFPVNGRFFLFYYRLLLGSTLRCRLEGNYGVASIDASTRVRSRLATHLGLTHIVFSIKYFLLFRISLICWQSDVSQNRLYLKNILIVRT